MAWVHGPCAVWGAWIEFAGWICPLTPLEIWLRRRAGEVGYERGFIEHYVLPVLYPSDLSRSPQLVLGIGGSALQRLLKGTCTCPKYLPILA